MLLFGGSLNVLLGSHQRVMPTAGKISECRCLQLMPIGDMDDVGWVWVVRAHEGADSQRFF